MAASANNTPSGVIATGLPASRRSILRGLTALPLVSVPAMAAAASAEPDPVFAAIEKHKAAWAAFEAAVAPSARIVGGGPPELREAVDRASDAETEARYDMHETVPQTVAGLVAYVAYWNSHMAEPSEGGTGQMDCIGWEAIPTIAEALATLLPATA